MQSSPGPPLNDGSHYDLVTSFFCCEAATSSPEECERYLGNLCHLLSPGGTLILAAARRCQAFSLAGNRFPIASVDEADFRDVLARHQFDLVHSDIHAIPIGQNWADQGAQSICLIKARKGS